MLDNKKNLIALIVAIVVLAGIFLFYLWRFSANSPATLDKVGRGNFPESGLSVFRPTEEETAQDFSGFSSFSDISKSAGFSALSFEKFLSEGGKFFEENFSAPTVTPFTPSPASRPSLSEEEIFERVWTTDYLRALKQIEGLVFRNGLLSEGFDVGTLNNISSEEVSDSEIIQNWSVASVKEGIPETDEEVYETILNILGQALASGLITQIEYNNFKNGVTGILPQIIEAEKEAFRRGLISKNILPRDQYFVPASRSDEAVKDFLDGLAYVFGLVRPAEAAWIRGADCYKDDAPFFPVPGFNGATFCCNCGIHIHCSSRGCFPHFHADCGEFSRTCHIPLGCLNAVCGAWPNAIWDPTTGICGCG